MTQREDIAWKFFGNKSSNQIGWPCKKIDGIWTMSVRYVKQFTDIRDPTMDGVNMESANFKF